MNEVNDTPHQSASDAAPEHQPRRGWRRALVITTLTAAVATAAVVALTGETDTGQTDATSSVAHENMVTGTVWVANEEGGSLTAIDAATNRVHTTVTGIGGPHNVQVSPDGTSIWAVSGHDAIAAMLDSAELTLHGAVPTGAAPAHVVVTPDGSTAYATNGADGTVTAIDTATMTPVATIPAGAGPHGLRPSPDGRWIYVANVADTTLSVIDTRTNTALGDIAVGESPAQVAFSPDGRFVYASLNGEDAVAKIDVAQRRVVGKVDVGDGPIQTYVTPDNTFVLVANQGTEDRPGTTVSIIDTMKALDASFKLGTLGRPIGVISEDRAAAVGGRIGGQAATIGLELSVENLDDGVSRTLTADVVDEPRLLPELLLASGFEAIDSVLDRVGAGTVEVTYQITGAGMPSSLERKDVFLSTTDIAVYPPWQLAEIVAYLQYNEFTDPKIDQISASMRVTSDLRAIRIEDLTLDSFVYSPGDAVRFTLTLQTFQGERIVRVGELVIPEDLMADDIVVRAYGGPRAIERGEAAETYESLADVIDLIETIPSYETVTVELFAVDPYLSYAEEALYGVGKLTHDYPGYVVYDEREVRGVILSATADSP